MYPDTRDRSSRPKVKLSMWVIAVLVLTLFASCSHVDRSTVDADDVAARVVQELADQRSSEVTPEDVKQLCALLAAVAAKNGLSVSKVLEEDLETSCDDGARGR